MLANDADGLRLRMFGAEISLGEFFRSLLEQFEFSRLGLGPSRGPLDSR